MGKAIAVMGCTFMLSPATMQGAPTPPTPSVKVQCGGAGAYGGPLSVLYPTIADGMGGVCAGASFSIIATALKVMIEGKPAILEGDQSAPTPCIFAGPPTAGYPKTVPVTCTVQAAGQVKVTGS